MRPLILMSLLRSHLRSKANYLLCTGLCFGAALMISPKVLLAQTADDSISIQINHAATSVDPPPQLKKGAVLVPLRGVLEKLGATVSYDAAKQQILVQQGGRTFFLKINIPTATLNQIEIPLTAAPAVEDGRTFVPLRSLAELFGYQVQWQGASKTVLINSISSINHLAALNKLGHFGVTIDTTSLTGEKDADLLLDAARAANAAFIKIRFDWSLLEPTEDAPFAWELFDYIVRGAKNRGMGVVGVLGNSAQWASIYQDTPDVNQWRNAPPQEKYFSNWDNYVRRVVGRYRNEVHAWQVWEYPASYNFRSGAKDYRTIVRRGAVMASLADPDAIVFAGEPGGVNLGFLHDLKDNGLTSAVKGIMLHPLSQWQPGVPASPAAFLLPHSTLRANKTQTYWTDALSWPVFSEDSPGKQIFYSDDQALLKRLKSTFTPQTQAEYLVKTMTLALASGMPKIVWGALRDEANYPKVDPVNSDTNSGLMTNSMQPRPAYEAFTNLNTLLRNAAYAGALAQGPDAVILLFSDGKQNSAVAWSLDQDKTTVTLQEVTPPPTTAAPTPVADVKEPASANSKLVLKTTAQSEILDVTGKVLSKEKKLRLTSSPVWVTNLDPAFVAQIQAATPAPLDALTTAPKPDFTNGVSADFSGNKPAESGLNWKKYAYFRGEAQPVSYNDVSGLITTVSRDIYNPAAGNPSIYLDVDDSYFYDEPGKPVKMEITLYRPPSTGTAAFRARGGFNIQYDSPDGFLFTPWQEVEQGTGLITYTVDIPRAAFTNRDGYDLIINTWGSKQDLIFRSIKLQREVTAPVAPAAPAAETETPAPTTDTPSAVQTAP